MFIIYITFELIKNKDRYSLGKAEKQQSNGHRRRGKEEQLHKVGD